MSFLEELKVVRSNGLRKSSIRLRTCEGGIFTEEFNQETRQYEAKKSGQESFGWVGDTKVDLQLAEAANNLYFGSQDVACDLVLLHKCKITHILNLTPNVENHFPNDFVYLRIPILDVPDTDILLHFPKANRFLSRSLSAGGRIFVHCNAGVSRSATIVAAYLISSQKLPLETILKQLKAMRPRVCPNTGFLKQLKDYEKIVNCNQICPNDQSC